MRVLKRDERKVLFSALLRTYHTCSAGVWVVLPSYSPSRHVVHPLACQNGTAHDILNTTFSISVSYVQQAAGSDTELL